MESMFYGLDLCAGIGGIPLGVRLATGGAYRTVCYVERDSYAAATLQRNMEASIMDKAPIWDDVSTFDGKSWRGIVDIITAGYPCQPFSIAGNRLAHEDDRYIWPDIVRVIREVEPAWVFLENVPNHLRLGFDSVIRDLHELDYMVTAGIFSAYETGAPHTRKRLFALAYSGCIYAQRYREPTNLYQETGTVEDRLRQRQRCWIDSNNVCEVVAKSKRPGLQGRIFEANGRTDELTARTIIGAFPPKPEELDLWEEYLDIYPDERPAVESELFREFDGFTKGIDKSIERSDRLRCVGNSVLPITAALAFVVLWSRIALAIEEG